MRAEQQWHQSSSSLRDLRICTYTLMVQQWLSRKRDGGSIHNASTSCCSEKDKGCAVVRLASHLFVLLLMHHGLHMSSLTMLKKPPHRPFARACVSAARSQTPSQHQRKRHTTKPASASVTQPPHTGPQFNVENKLSGALNSHLGDPCRLLSTNRVTHTLWAPLCNPP